MDLIERAREILTESPVGVVDRDQVVAFAYLSALRDHYPDLCTDTDQDLIRIWEPVRVTEYDRFVKQRRLALSRLSQILSP